MKKAVLFAALVLCGWTADAGIIRHVVVPVAKASWFVAKRVPHVVKVIVY